MIRDKETRIGILTVSDRASKGIYEDLPGKPKAIRECMQATFPAIPYCVDLIGGPFLEYNEKFINAFRPDTR